MIRRALLLAAVAILAACGGGGGGGTDAPAGFAGTLHSPPGSNYYDFNHIDALQRPWADLASGAPAEMAATFTWGGEPDAPVADPQHVVAAFMQATVTTGAANALGQITPTHGAGALISGRGLVLEVWHRDTPDSPTNGTTWSQYDDRCARDVLGTLPANTQCLASVEGAADYITAAPGFQLRKGVAYTVRVTVKRTGPNVVRVSAELWQGADLVQRGMVHVEGAKHYPAANLPVLAIVARTPGEPLIYYSQAAQ